MDILKELDFSFPKSSNVGEALAIIEANFRIGGLALVNPGADRQDPDTVYISE
jgi:hypothetical protein